MTLSRITGYGVGSAKITLSAPPVVGSGAPSTSTAQNYSVGQLYIDKVALTMYGLVSVAAGVSTWVPLGGGSAAVAQLTADSGTAIPVAGSIKLAGGTGLSTVASGSTVTFNVTGMGEKYTVVTADTSMAINSGYITNKAGTAASMLLPGTAAVGSVVSIVGLGATGWKVTQAAGQIIHMNSASSTTGVTGSLASTAQYNTVELVCTVANTDWTVLSSEGVLTVT